ncbi:hypothetical protein [Enterobacter hormaechei]|uniref:hypothetical protein n=1 Tax=Enterobacter hormaechei TaxID=158836 RepID=UPI000CEC3111|nr:hypothetical protein [Enterobacter hormaechei]ROC77474.1 hypothetical protein C4Z25_014885 [Enterobacter hormaechei subsp. steigerwaltii]
MSELTMNLYENKAKPKSFGYVVNRLATAASIILAVVLVFVILSSLGRLSPVAIAVLVLLDVALLIYVRAQFRSSKLIKLVDSMKVKNFFSPGSDEQIMRAQKCYFGIDTTTGIIGVGTLYEIGANKQKRLYFDTDMVESYETVGNQLVLKLRSKAIPTLKMTVLDGELVHDNIRYACNKRDEIRNARANVFFEKNKSMMVEAGWMIERDY